MSAPQVVAVVPDVNETDVVLGQAISITFDQEIDTTSLSDSTFSLTCPALTQVVTNNQLISGESSPSTIVVHGTWTFNTAPNGATVAVFQPSRGFTPNTSYTATLLGADAALSTEDVHNPAGEPMAQSYSWTFISGALSLKTPPPTSPCLMIILRFNQAMSAYCRAPASARTLDSSSTSCFRKISTQLRSRWTICSCPLNRFSAVPTSCSPRDCNTPQS